MIELIVDWIFGALLDMLSAKHISGEWRLSYLFPIVTGLGAGLWWIADRFDLVVLMALAILITVICGLGSVLTFIPREVESWRDIRTLRERGNRESKSTGKDSEEKQ